LLVSGCCLKSTSQEKGAISRKKGDLLMKKRLYILLTTIVPFSILLLAGCGGSASLGSRALPDNDWPKKRVMVMPASDLSGAGFNELIGTVSEELAKILRKTGFFNVYHQDKTKKFPLFKPGEPADPGLMREAREMGMNAIIFETVNPIETNPVRGGIWPFRKKAGRLTVSINIDILDVNRETVLLSREIAEDLTVSDEEAKVQKQESTDVETKKRALKECLPDIVKKAARVASLSLNQEVWSCRIVSADKEGIIINAGHDAGLRPGIVFEVFAQGESISSCKGQTHRLPGPKVGEIKISSIEPRHSSAQPINGTGFKTGQIVRVKD
jgi:hypothetical protein